MAVGLYPVPRLVHHELPRFATCRAYEIRRYYMSPELSPFRASIGVGPNRRTSASANRAARKPRSGPYKIGLSIENAKATIGEHSIRVRIGQYTYSPISHPQLCSGKATLGDYEVDKTT